MEDENKKEKRWQRFLLDLLFPPSCQLCGRAGGYLCLNCLGKLQGAPLLVSAPAGIAALIAAGDYSEISRRRLIKRFKYGPLPGLKEPLAELLLAAWRQAGIPGPFIVVPLPLNRQKERRRGFNQAEELARRFCQATGLEFCSLLKRDDRQTSQARLQAQERRRNLKGVFSCLETNLEGARLLLIDDVATTGTTLAEAARVLKEAGAGEIYALVLAASRLRSLQTPRKGI